MDMIERVARAIHEKAYETRGDDRIPDWKAVARAAIEAMREPTMEMIEAGAVQHKIEHAIPNHPNPELSSAAQCWRGMVDAALVELDT